MPKTKRRLNPFPQRAPEWLEDPKMRAAFVGGLTDAAVQQGQFMTQRRGEARVERGEAENLRRWELLRGERKGAQDWRQNLEEQRKVRQEAQDKLTKEKWAYTQEGPKRTFELQKRLAEMRDEMEFERQTKQIKERLEALATYEAGEKKMRQEGAPEERIQEYRRQAAIRNPELAEQLRKAAPKPAAAAKAPYEIDPDSPEAQRIKGLIAAQPGSDYDKERNWQNYLQTGKLLSPPQASAAEQRKAAAEQAASEDEAAALDAAYTWAATENPDITPGIRKRATPYNEATPEQQEAFIIDALTKEWAQDNKGNALPPIAKEAVRQAVIGLIERRKGELQRRDRELEQQPAHPAQQPAQAAQPEAGLTPERQQAIEDLKANARGGDPKAVAYLRAKGIPF